jgi:hypothetical protein
MRRSEAFGLRVDGTERQMIIALAKRLQRSQSDAVRLVIREAASAVLGARTGEPGREPNTAEPSLPAGGDDESRNP